MIEFRGRRIDNNEWVYGLLIQGIKETQESYIVPIEIYNFYETKKDNSFSLVIEKYNQVVPETIAQYMGLTDSFRNKIYENMKVKTTSRKTGSTEIFTTKFSMGNACLCFDGCETGTPIYPTNVSYIVEILE